MAFPCKRNEEVQRLVDMLDKNQGMVIINDSNGKMSVNLSNPKARQKIIETPREFYKSVRKAG